MLQKLEVKMKKILLIEDNISISDELSMILSLEGYEMLTADNGKLGLLLANSLIPDLIISDIFMGEGLDGFDILAEIRANNLTRDIPFIFITSAAGKTSQLYADHLGADDYLIKPFVPEILLNTVKLQMEKRTSSIVSII